MDMLQYFKQHPEVKHGTVKIGFVPDEEQGLRGAKAFDTKEFGADFAYTLDCCGIGELVYENWNAGDVEITFTGASAHPMSAKGKLKNSLLMAHKFVAMLPGGEAPEYTEGREGYYWVKQLAGNSARTILKMDVRDFTEKGYAQRMAFLKQLSEYCEGLWGKVLSFVNKLTAMPTSLIACKVITVIRLILLWLLMKQMALPLVQFQCVVVMMAQRSLKMACLVLISLPVRIISTLFMNICQLNRFTLLVMS